MDLRPGYKQTEIGPIPEDWDAVPLGSIGESLIGLTYAPAEVRNSGILVLRSSNIQNDELSFEDNVFVKKDVPFKIMVRPGDVLICVRNGSADLIGKSALLDERTNGMTFGAFMAVYRSEIGVLVNYLFQSSILKRQINEHLGATINQITNKSLNSFRIPLARDLREQNAIAKALRDVDGAISSMTQLLAKKRDLRTGTIQQLVTGRTRLLGFSEPWQKRPLAELCEMKSGEGITSARIDTTSPFPCYGGNGLRGFAKTYTHEGDFVLIGRVGALCGNILRVSGRFFASEHAIVVAPRETTDPNFLGMVLSRMRLGRLSESSAQPVLTVSKLLKLEVSYPPSKDEQTAIAGVLSDMDAEITALAARLDKTQALKQGMMQALLTGRVRLPVKGEALDELEAVHA
ncbi:restriction endonuclease subunit S [Paracoccus subflavus]|uniref:Restriction endonuclease subunit S n=1 Tax=Paracoccus subflavus TaxID=2528244 RepID=A0A4Q9GA33_9RHOB|nr:restriction endonuclease subunit S [Paracoccus subflavus]TBN43625.1 restriction endonuclease subunit S [Paracoccus subflavus]